MVFNQNVFELQLPKFFYLCEDGVWGVRKACAECFMAVSNTCSPEVRKKDLSSLFVSLLFDQSRWVRKALSLRFYELSAKAFSCCKFSRFC